MSKTNKWRILAPENITSKQWLVLAAVGKILGGEPTIQDVARQLSTSHQNVKAIALNLEKRGFLQLKKDPKDRRVTRLAITTQSQALWQAREDVDKSNLVEVFQLLSNEEIRHLKESLFKLMQGADQMSEKIEMKK
ncbi:MAG: regulatory protein MarR [Bacillales bacterium]|nr:regulatory protein MarR [Bacillales bacterium]